ncbi:MAG TPA: thioesterase family protein [Candidatus Binatia bacterium]|jgi:acyl-CoA thioester hydrolase
MKKNVCFYRVIYGDTDQMGVVYYANYLRWFEMGRTELLRQLGAPYSSIEERGLFFPVTEVSGRYVKSARFDDEIAVETYIQEIERATIVFGYKILRKNDRALLVEGWTRHACLDRQGKVVRIPREIDDLLRAAMAD